MYRSSSISVTEAWLTFLFIVLASALAFRSLVPPAAVPASAPISEFSAARAFKHLQFVAREPHPTGSAANALLRDYLVEQLKSMGLAPQVQKAVAATSWDIGGAPYGAGVVQNIIVRMSGTNSTGTVLLIAHYDSVQTGPGAGDNGSGVVTLLETARALRSSASLKNNVLIVFSDGEEDGGLGAQAFVDEHPLAKDVSVAIVADGNGCGRAALSIFDRHNGWLVREIAGAVPHPLAASIGDEVSKLAGGFAMGDQVSFYKKGVPALGLGAGGCQTGYHTPEDKLGNIDLRTLQDLGNCAVRLTRKFGNTDLKDIRQDEVIYFAILGYLILYSAKCVLPLTVITLVIVVAIVAVGLKRKILTRRGLTLGFLLWASGVIAASASIALAWWVLRSLHKVNSSFTSAYNAQLYAIAFVALAAAVVSGIYAASRERMGAQNFAAGAALFCGALILVTQVFAPAGTYLVIWPLLSALLPLGYAFALKEGDSAPLKLVKLFCAIPAIACFVPLIGFLSITTVDPGQNLVIVGILTAILVALLAPQLEVMVSRNKALLPGVCAMVACAFVLLGVWRSGYDVQHPKPDSISYWLDSDSATASWISFDEKPDDWTSQYLSSQPQTDKVSIFATAEGDSVLKAPAPALSLPLPLIRTVEDSSVGSERALRFQISSPRHARVIWVVVRSAAVVRAALEGRNVQVGEADRRNKLWGFIFIGLPPEGIRLDVTVKAPDTPQFTLTDQSDGLPEIPALSTKPRSGDRMSSPQVWPFFDLTTLVSRTFPIELNRRPSLDGR
jgi:hypothetical protein